MQDLRSRERKARLLLADEVNMVVEGHVRVDIYTEKLPILLSPVSCH